MSSDGSRVVFTTYATNLNPIDADSASDVYVRDLHSAETVLVSRRSGQSGGKVLDYSQSPSISSDGSRVAFSLLAGDLFETDHLFAETSSIWVRDLELATTELASRTSGPNGAFHGNNGSPAISSDGSTIAFTGPRTLEPRKHPGYAEIARRDLNDLTTHMIDRNPSVPKGRRPAESLSPSVDHSGSLVAFSLRTLKSDGGKPTRRIYLAEGRRRAAEPLAGIGRKLRDEDQATPSLSSNGRWVSFVSETRAGIAGGSQDIFTARVGE